MSVMKFWLILLLWLAIETTVSAQSVHQYTSKSKKAIESYEKSTNFFMRRQYGYALELLHYAVKKDNNFSEAHYRLGKIYYAMRNEAQARDHFQKVVKQQPNDPRFADAHLLLANLYFGEGDYDKAQALIQQIMQMEQVASVIKEDARYLADNIAFTKQEINNPLPYNPQPVGGEMNQLALQYFPVLTVDQQTLIFTGRRGITPQYDEDIFISEKDSQGNWKIPSSLSENINSPLNEGTCTIAADGRTLIYTACEGRGGFGSCDLYITRKTGNQWSSPQNLGAGVNSRAWESQPSLSADGRTLYFVSDRAGGVGRMDIYVSHLNDSSVWSAAENVGPEINTPRDEVSPFIHVNGQTLYFASNGRPGFGGYDLYFSENDGQWSAPKNLGYPINTYQDQASLFITADGRDGYYSDEETQDNHAVSSKIYQFEIPESIRVANRSSYVQGTVYNAATQQPLKASIELIDLQEQQKIAQVYSDSITGKYLMVLTEGADYALYANRPNFLFKSLTFDYQKQESDVLQPVTIDIYLDPVEKGRETVLNNIFFNTDKYDIKEKSKPELNKIATFLQENPDIRIAINGHTDNVGAPDYNQTLSTNRAKAVYEYLVDTGVSADRLAYRGYGQDKPIAPNDTEVGRQKNRRIAFEVL